QYDYDGALEILNSVKGADQDADLSSRIAEYELQKTNLVPTSPQAVTHVFFHSLVVDPERGFAHPEDPLTAGFCQWMTTVDEFNAMLEQMRSEEHTSELQSRFDLVCRLLLEKKKRH